MSKLKIVVPPNFVKVGEKINVNINKIKRTDNKNYIIKPELSRFTNGEGKCIYTDSLRGKDVFIFSDVSNDSITYPTRNGLHHMMPDEHFQDIKRMINAICNHANRVFVVMPYLY